MPSVREKYFSIKKENNKYLNDSVIKTILSYVGGFLFEDFALNLEKEIDDVKLNPLLDRLRIGEPIQYVTNEAFFLGNKFYVDSNVLIPRQETEKLVLDLVKLNFIKNPVILDIGTGSGCIIVSLKKMLKSQCFAVDISKSALNIAQVNAVNNGAEITFIESDILSNLSPEIKFDIIVSNPPYIKDEKTVDKSTLKYEPHLALFAKPQTYFYEEIIKQSIPHLKEHFIIAFEIEEDMEISLENIIRKYLSDVSIIFEKDIYSKTRYLYIIKK